MFRFFTFSKRKTTEKTAPQSKQATASPVVLSEKALPLISEKHLPPPPAYETVVVVAAPPAYSPTALFPSRDAEHRPILSTRPRRSIRAPANLDMSSCGPHLLPPPRSAGRCLVVTSKPSVAGFEITKNLGFVQASATSLGEVKLLLRLQGEDRRAFAILDVVITTSDNSVFTAVGRAVRLRKA
ncbi:hypothetical protein C6P46_004124 [Rhodotorula mucilaginosa]|uniref:Uncharacterized protein n=1 Tax=Rhodotorula mucilaginosa TaxID=5537 RepID=A0A9P6W339_RHOMI|nr:hypothetical protein C6P46_004124 [Rhodotorula mucilaginosa]